MDALWLESRLKGVQPPTSSGWINALCPGHDDGERPSFGFRTTADGQVGAIKCLAGCSLKQIADGLGVSVDAFRRHPGRAGKKIQAVYDYLDEHGTLLYQVCRFENKELRYRKPDPTAKGGWTWSAQGVRRVLYRLPDLENQGQVFIAEGEKDTDTLALLDLASTTNPGGAGKWEDAYTQQLIAAGLTEVVILPDNDPPGVDHAWAVARSCLAAGLRVKIVLLPELAAKGDVSDWIEAGHTREELEALGAAAPWLRPEDVPAAEGDSGAGVLDSRLVDAFERLTKLPEYPDDHLLLEPLDTIATILVSITDATKRELATKSTYTKLRVLKINDRDAKALLKAALAKAQAAKARPAKAMSSEERERRIAELTTEGKEVLDHQDPLQLILEELPHIGYGGDPAPVLIGLLAATTRVLDVFSIPGAAVGHLQFQGPSSAGKTFIVSMVRRFLPPEVWRDAGGSTKSLVYVNGSYAHTVLLFPEMDSLPKGGTDDQNVIASAVRGLLSEHRLIYRVTVRVPEDEGGGFETREIDLAGPTVMFTTGLGQLEKQYSTRTFTYKVSAEVDEIVAKLEKAGHNEAARDTREPRPALLALQQLIQLQAPWDVWVPFADQIARHSAVYTRKNKKVGPRVLRDLNKIFSFIKAATILNHAHRRQDERGRWIAEVADYAVVYSLVGDLYQEAVTGAEKRIRQVVETVTALVEEYRTKNATNPTAPSWGPNAKQVGEALGISTPGVTHYIVEALAQGWLVDLDAEAGSEHRGPSRRPYRLVPGDPLPELGALIPPSDLIGLTSPENAAMGAGSDDKPPKPGPRETLNAKPQETQAENGTFKRLTHTGGENGAPPRRNPVHLPSEDRPKRTPVK